MRDLDPHQFAAVTRMKLRQQCLALQRDGMGHKPRTVCEMRPQPIEHRGIKASADKDRLRRFQTRQDGWRGSLDHRDAVGQAEGFGVVADIGGAFTACLDRKRDAAVKRPFNGDRSRARASHPGHDR